MKTIQEVQAYLLREKQGMHSPLAPDRLILEVLEEVAGTCQSVEEFIEKAQAIPVTGAGIEQVQIANEMREYVLEQVDLREEEHEDAAKTTDEND